MRLSRCKTILCAFLLVPTMVNAQACHEILEHGVFATSDTETLRIRVQKLLNWLSQSTFESYQQALDSGAKLGFVLDDLPINVSGYEKYSNWRQYQASLQTLDLSDTRTLDQFRQVTSTADRAIVSAWRDCILNNKGVAHALIEQGYDAKQFTLDLTYSPVGPPEKAGIYDLTISPGSPEVTCKPVLDTGKYLHDYITSAGRILNCSRQQATQAVLVTGNTEKGELSAKLPGMVPPIAPRKPKFFAEDEAGVPYHIDWSTNGDCKSVDSSTPKAPHRCKFSATQRKIPNNGTAYDHWDMEIDAPGPVYEVWCTPGHEELNQDDSQGGPHAGTWDGNTATCQGWINGGKDSISMTVKYKMLRY
jgi:hypothetical protein